MMVVFMFSVIGIMGGAIDVGSWLHSKQSLQAAADAAALAGGSRLANGWGSAQSAAADEFAKNDAVGDSAEVCRRDADEDGEHGGESSDGERDHEREPRSPDELREDVLAAAGRAEQVMPGRA